MMEIVQAAPAPKGMPKPGGTDASSASADAFGSLVAPLAKDQGGSAQAKLLAEEGSQTILDTKAAEPAGEGKATFIAGLVALDDVVTTEPEATPAAEVLDGAELAGEAGADPIAAALQTDAIDAASLRPGKGEMPMSASADPAARKATKGAEENPATRPVQAGTLGTANPVAASASGKLPIGGTAGMDGTAEMPDTPGPRLPQQAIDNAGQKAAPTSQPAIAAAQTAAGDGAIQSAAATQPPVRQQASLRADADKPGTAMTETGDAVDTLDTLVTSDRAAVKPTVVQTVADKPASPAQAFQATMAAAEQAMINGERVLAEMQARGEQRGEQLERQLTLAATGRSGVDHVALGRMYAPPGATPIGDFAMQVTRRITGGATKFDIRLDPPELGRVDVSVEMKGDKAVIRLVVERSETLDFLARDARTLERTLQDAGINADASEMKFSLGQDGEASAGGSDRDDADDGAKRPEDTLLAEIAPVGRTIRANALLDLMI